MTKMISTTYQIAFVLSLTVALGRPSLSVAAAATGGRRLGTWGPSIDDGINYNHKDARSPLRTSLNRYGQVDDAHNLLAGIRRDLIVTTTTSGMATMMQAMSKMNGSMSGMNKGMAMMNQGQAICSSSTGITRIFEGLHVMCNKMGSMSSGMGKSFLEIKFARLFLASAYRLRTSFARTERDDELGDVNERHVEHESKYGEDEIENGGNEIADVQDEPRNDYRNWR